MCFSLQFKLILKAFFSFLASFITTFILLANIVPYFKPPQFSLIVSTYNYGHFLPELIESILRSSEKDFELIIVNDGSTDNTQEIIEKYAQKDNRIRFINQENKGLSIARNNAMKIAKGDYFWFVDADDEIDKEALLTLKKVIYKLRPDIISFYVQSMDIHKNLLEKDFYSRLPEEVLKFQESVFTAEDISSNTIVWYPVSSAKQIYRREFVQKNNIIFPPKTFFEDDVFFFHSLFSKAKVAPIIETLYYIRKHPKSITSDKTKYYDSTVRISMLIYDRLKRVSTEENARVLFNSYFSGALKKWNNLSIEQKRMFYPVLVELSDWISQKEKDAYWDEQQKKLTDFMQKEKDLIFQKK